MKVQLLHYFFQGATVFMHHQIISIYFGVLCGLYSVGCMGAAVQQQEIKTSAQRAVIVPEQQQEKRQDAWLPQFPQELRTIIKQYYLDYVSLLPVLYKSVRVRADMSSERSPFAICSDGKVVNAVYDRYGHQHHVRVLNIDGSVQHIIKKHAHHIQYLEMGLDDSIILASENQSAIVKVQQGDTNDTITTIKVGARIEQAPIIGHDGRITISAPDCTERQPVYDKNGQELYKVHHSCVWASAFGPDGTLVTGAKNIAQDYPQLAKNHKLLLVWNPDGSLKHSLEGHTSHIFSVAVGQDGTIVSGSYDKTARMWNRDGSCRNVLRGHKAGVHKVIIKSDNSIVTADQNYIIKVWNVDGVLQATLRGHEKMHIQCLEASRHGTVISSSYHGMVRMWDDRNQNCVTFNGAHRGRIGKDGTVAVHLKNNVFEIWHLDPACVTALLQLSFEQLGHVQWLLQYIACHETKKVSDIVAGLNDEQQKRWAALPTWVQQKMLQWQ